MFGAIIGDTVGSRFEWNNIKTKDFEFLHEGCFFTDDTVMTIAVANALLDCNGDYSELEYEVVDNMVMWGKRYPLAGYGGRFIGWINSENHEPYNSWGNGSAMRVSPVAYVGKTIEEVKELSKIVSATTHNHLEGIKGAEATAVATFLALQGKDKEYINNYIKENYYPEEFTLDEIREDYGFDVSCQGSVPQAIEAFYESTDFEDAIRNAISIGGDSDTIAAITGAIAGAYYGIPDRIMDEIVNFLDDEILEVIDNFETTFNK